jgi:hypothetical protein
MKTIKVRIALVINSEGEWSASGWDGMEDFDEAELDLGGDHAEARYWIECEIPVPAAWNHVTVKGEAVPA